MMRTAALLLLAGCCCAAVQETLPAELEQQPVFRRLLEAALQTDERVLAAQRRIAAAQEVVNQIDAGRLPQIMLGASSALRHRDEDDGPLHTSERASSYQFSVRGVYSLDMHGRHKAQRDAAEAAVRVAQGGMDQSRADVMHDTARAVAEAVSLHKRLQIRRSLLADIEALLDKTAQLLERSAVPRTVLASIERERVLAGIAIIDLESSLQISLQLLSSLTGLQVSLEDLPEVVVLDAYLPSAEQQAVEIALNNSIAVAVATAAMERIASELALAETSRLPTYNVEISHARAHASDEKDLNTRIALSVDYPVYDGGLNAARLAELRHSLRGAQHELEHARRLARRSAGQIWSRLRSAVKARDALEQNLLIAEKSLIDAERLLLFQQEPAMALIRVNQSVADIRLSIVEQDYQIVLAVEQLLYESNSLARLLD